MIEITEEEWDALYDKAYRKALGAGDIGRYGRRCLLCEGLEDEDAYCLCMPMPEKPTSPQKFYDPSQFLFPLMEY